MHNNVLSHILWFVENGLEPEWLVREVSLHLLRFATPLEEGNDNEEVKRYMHKLTLTASQKGIRQLSSLRCPMGPSMLYKKAAEKKRKSTGGQSEADAKEGDTKQQKTEKGSKSSGGNKKGPKFEEDFAATTSASSTSVSRAKLWLDDMFRALLSPLACLKPEQVNKRAVVTIAIDALAFMLSGSVTLNGKELKC